MLQVYKHNLRKTEYFFPNRQLVLYQKYIVGLSLMLCYIIHLNQEIKVKLKCYVCKKWWFSPKDP